MYLFYLLIYSRCSAVASLTGSDWEQSEVVTAHTSAGDKQMELINSAWIQISYHSFTGPLETGHRNPGAVPAVNYSETIINTACGHLHKQDHRVCVHSIGDSVSDHLRL